MEIKRTTGTRRRINQGWLAIRDNIVSQRRNGEGDGCAPSVTASLHGHERLGVALGEGGKIVVRRNPGETLKKDRVGLYRFRT